MNLEKYRKPVIEKVFSEFHPKRYNIYLVQNEEAYDAMIYLEKNGVNVREFVKSILIVHAERMKKQCQDNQGETGQNS